MASPSTSASMREQMTRYIETLQDIIVSALENLDPDAPKFTRRAWDRTEGGRGVSCTFSAPPGSTSALEKAGVNISMIHGTLAPAAVKQMSASHASLKATSTGTIATRLPFFAGGISLVIHPRNPRAPSAHANYRYFEVTEAPPEEDPDTAPASPKVKAWWFGGITDLTPSYLYPDHCVLFHKTLKAACDKYSEHFYPAFKKSCDGYFFLPHRGEHRGIGGIRFDDLSDEPCALLPGDADENRPRTAQELFEFIKTCGDAFLPSYLPILKETICAAVDSDGRMRRWQLLRRGRYVEFNLVYDRGTKFGLATEGVNIENVLMSLPEEARWEYMSELGEEEGSEEYEMAKVLKQAREWV